MGIMNLFKKKQPKSKILIESQSPICPLKVIIEECNDSTYMYLLHKVDEGEPIFKNACWLSNHNQAPKDINRNDMKSGKPSMLPAEFCKHPQGISRFNSEKLEVVWFEEGNGVAVLYPIFK